MEIIFKDAKTQVDNIIDSLGSKIQEIIITDSEFNDLMKALRSEWEKQKSSNTIPKWHLIGYKMLLYRNVRLNTKER